MLQLRSGQSGPWSGLGFGVQPVRLSIQPEPADECFGMDTEDASDGSALLALMNELDGSSSPAFQFSGGSKWSAHNSL